MCVLHLLPARERAFVHSLQYHGFRLTTKRRNLKFSRGYVVPATRREDSGGIDLWVKMPRDARLLPIQITQRGVRMFRVRQRPSAEQLAEFLRRRERKLAMKRRMCKQAGIAFVLVRDHEGARTNPTLAWGDIKSLRYWIAR